MQYRIKLIRFYFQQRFSSRQLSFFHHIHGYFERRRRCSLAVSRLKHIKLSALYGILHILHIGIVIFKPLGYRRKFSIYLRHILFELRYRMRRANTRYDVFALCVHKSFFSPVAGLRVNATPVPQSSPIFPKTIIWTLTAVPQSDGM